MLFGVAFAAEAHHSAAAEYYAKIILLRGSVTKVAWMNPHVWIYFDTADAAGKVTHWECEGSAPGGLISNGWSRGTLKPGDHVALEGSLAKVRPNGFKIRAVRLSNGRRLLMGGTDEGLPDEQR